MDDLALERFCERNPDCGCNCMSCPAFAHNYRHNNGLDEEDEDDDDWEDGYGTQW